MELKEFIVKTVSEIFDAVSELQVSEEQIKLPGAVSPSSVSSYNECSLNGRSRLVTPIHFNLVLDAETEETKSGLTAGGIQVFSASKARKDKISEQVSQNISFDLNVILPSVVTVKRH